MIKLLKLSIRLVGHSYVMTVPKDFVDNGLLVEGKKYNALLEETE